jgi:hypothetical protein
MGHTVRRDKLRRDKVCLARYTPPACLGERKPYWTQTGQEKKPEKSVLATIQTTNRRYSKFINNPTTGTGQRPGRLSCSAEPDEVPW